MNGCPDSDGDGVPDNEDECPEQEGSIELNGCPDADADDVADKDDECPEEPGAVDNKVVHGRILMAMAYLTKMMLVQRRRELPKIAVVPNSLMKVVQTINELATKINFAAGTDRIMGKAVINTLNEIKKLLDENPKVVW